MIDAAAIQRAIEAHLATIAGLPPVVWTRRGEPYAPPWAGLHIRATALGARTDKHAQGEFRARGLVQLDVFHAAAEADAAAAVVAAVLAAFAPDTRLPALPTLVVDRAERGDDQVDAPWRIASLILGWAAFQTE